MLRRLIALMFVLFIALPVSAEWVEVLLKDGRTFSGEVLEETSSKIRIRTKMAGIDTEMTFGANEVRNIDRKKSNGPASAPATGPSAAAPTAPSAPDKKTKETGGYAVVPLKGTIGEEITAQFLKEAVERAKKEGAEAVVFHIDSGGGLVRELSDIRDYLDSVTNMKVAFFIDQDAMSAAALMCLSSRNFYMGKGGLRRRRRLVCQ